jgi:uncharacterized protein YbjT (DUF2867 family)
VALEIARVILVDVSRTAVIAGASGLVGSLCLKLLLEDESYDRVVAVSRRALAVSHPKLQQEIVDFGALGEHPAWVCDAVFCALGTTIRTAGSQAAFRRVDYDFVQAFAKWTHAGGAQSFALVSSVGANAASGNFYIRTKGEAEESVKNEGFRDTHLFRPSLLMGDRSERRFGESVAAAVMLPLQFALLGGLMRYRPARALDVARAMVAASSSPRPGVHVYEYTDIVRLRR